MTLYTAQYRYQGQDRIDITIKGSHIVGKAFAPTWEMVVGIKKLVISDDDYTKAYYDLLTDRWANDLLDIRSVTEKLVTLFGPVGRDITLVCFCPAGAFCHRHLLVRWLTHNWPTTQYGGERHV